MDLIIGGLGQGKLAYVLQATGFSMEQVTEHPEREPDRPVFNHLEGWVGEVLARGESPKKALEPILAAHPNLVILCDEVGCGVVPMDKGERLWREEVGRLCCDLAQAANSVTRLFCGLPTHLKGVPPWK